MIDKQNTGKHFSYLKIFVSKRDRKKSRNPIFLKIIIRIILNYGMKTFLFILVFKRDRFLSKILFTDRITL